MNKRKRLRYLRSLRKFAYTCQKATSEGELKMAISQLPGFRSMSISYGWSTVVFVGMEDMEEFSGRNTRSALAIQEACSSIYRFYANKYLKKYNRKP